MKLRKCACKSCKLYERYKKAIASSSIEETKHFIEEIMGLLLDAQDDLSWHEAVMDGSWPDSIEILERSMEKAVKKAQERLKSTP